MSSKQEPAQAPATVSQTDSGPQNVQQHPPHQQQQQQPPPQQYHQGQVVYQQFAPVPHYQPQGTPVWNQPPQTIHYVPYQHQQAEVGYQDKVQGFNHYGTVHFAQPIDNGEMMIRNGPRTFVQQQYVPSPQWYPPAGQPPPPGGQFIPTYATNFNVANDPSYNPNHPMNRQPMNRREEFQGDASTGYMQFVPFVAPMGVLESQAHASASYTANWVCSTSSIPPELKDEPESDNISQYDNQRPTSQLNGETWNERDEHFSPSTAHHQAYHQQPNNFRPGMNSGEKSFAQGDNKKGKIVKNLKTERNEDKRELTFDERLEKARMQKDRVENEGANGASSPNTTSAVQGSTATSIAPQQYTPRSNGQRKEYPGVGGHVRNEGYHNNNNGMNNNAYSHNSGRGGRGGGHHHGQHHPNGNSNVVGGEQSYQARQQGAGAGERDRQPRRDNIYTNRFENQHNPQFNQNQKPHHQRDQHGNGAEFYRQPSYRGRGGRGGFNPNQRFPPPFPHHQPHQNHPGGPFMVPQMMDPQLLATINAFQNTHINLPPGVSRIPLLPGPFGMPRQMQFQQDVKFRNTWLDATSCPLPVSAVMNIDTRMRNGGPPSGYRGRGRGGYGWRGGYRGGYHGNGVTHPRLAPEVVHSLPKETEEAPKGNVEAATCETNEKSDTEGTSNETPNEVVKTSDENTEEVKTSS